MNIVLCGMMGCGKTTVAETLSRLYGHKLIDTDAVIVSRFGSIDEIFKSRGEIYFRDIESRVVEEICAEYRGAVIATGGGCVLRGENVEALKRTGKIFYLRTDAETIISRLKGDKTRPLLAGDIEGRVRSILAARSDIYEAVADFIVDTDNKSSEQIAREIEEIMQ